ncbi:uncharacterized protein LOC141911009 [Tubulanus polymorphus]|uniref:uncharacterized protein LOC141911009 n=1 Tax=Tubulanus polymorphus TaxID=672921 RepID=UPI003DA3F0DF
MLTALKRRPETPWFILAIFILVSMTLYFNCNNESHVSNGNRDDVTKRPVEKSARKARETVRQRVRDEFIVHSKKRPRIRPEKFHQPPLMKADEIAEYTKLIGEFDAFAKTHNLTYMLFGHSLLGAFRHHGFIPWDDLFTVTMSEPSMNRMTKVLRNADDDENRPTFDLRLNVMREGKYMKVFKPYEKGNWIKLGWEEPYPWTWPYIDIYPYREEGLIVQYTSTEFGKNWDKKRHVFPLIKMPFEGLRLPVPRRVDLILNRQDAVERCDGNKYNHKREARINNPTQTPCNELTKEHPFVKRTCSGGATVKETLELDGLALHTWTYKMAQPGFPTIEACVNER